VISFKHILTAAAGVLIIAVSVRAQDHSHMSMPMMPETADKRRLVEFPPAMRQHMLSNMRAHSLRLAKSLLHFRPETARKRRRSPRRGLVLIRPAPQLVTQTTALTLQL
jgi:hypothetical protein